MMTTTWMKEVEEVGTVATIVVIVCYRGMTAIATGVEIRAALRLREVLAVLVVKLIAILVPIDVVKRETLDSHEEDLVDKAVSLVTIEKL